MLLVGVTSRKARFSTFGAAIDIWPPRRVAFEVSAGQDKPGKIRLCSEEIRHEGRSLARRRFLDSSGEIASP
jgi:hypothetical protein